MEALPLWQFLLVFGSTVIGLAVFLYHFVTKIEEFFMDEERQNGQLAHIFRMVSRAVVKNTVAGSKIAFKYISLLLEQTLLKSSPDTTEDVSETPTTQRHQRQVAPEQEAPATAHAAPAKNNFSILLHEAELLVKAIDKNQDALTHRQLSRVDVIVDSIVFLEDETRNISQDSKANEVLRFKLYAMINELKEIHQSTLHVWPKVSNY